MLGQEVTLQISDRKVCLAGSNNVVDILHVKKMMYVKGIMSFLMFNVN